MRLIYVDEFDAHAWQEALVSSPYLNKLWTEGGAAHPLFQDQVADTFQLLYQALPRWLAPLTPTLQEALLREISGTQEFSELKILAEGDIANATMATDILGRKVFKQLSPSLQDRLDQEAGSSAAGADEITAPAPGTGSSTTGHNTPPGHPEGAISALSRDPHDPLDEELGSMRRLARKAAAEAIQAVEVVESAQLVLGDCGPWPLSEKLELAERLQRSATLRSLVAMAGRMRRLALQKRATIVPCAREEVVGVTMGRDLERLLPSELGLLGSAATKPLFFKKWLDGELLSLEETGKGRLGHGPILICLDGSGSMAGAKELWSKSVLLGYMRIAEHERRDLQVCQFGGPGQLQIYHFPFATRPREVNREALLRAVEEFLEAGDTDLEPPLRWAIDELTHHTGGDHSADIAILTDAECSFSNGFLKWWKQQRDRLDFTVYGVLIGAPAAEATLRLVADQVVSVDDLADDAAATELLFGAKKGG